MSFLFHFFIYYFILFFLQNVHAALNSSKSCCSICVVTKVEWLIKGGEHVNAPAGSAGWNAHTECHKGKSRPRKTQMKKMHIEIWLCFISPQKSKILCIKKKHPKTSFVLASISKKCKLKFDKNISLVQNSSTGISSEILSSSYHALSGWTGVSALRRGQEARA